MTYELSHYGVKGMKWGNRKVTATTSEIKKARKELSVERQKILGQNRLDRVTDRKGTTQARKDRWADFKNDDRQAIALKTTRGEKALLLLVNPMSIPIRELQSRQIAENKRLKFTE